MVDIRIPETDTTPEVILNSENALFSIKGNSYPENPNEFYQPLVANKNAFIKSVQKDCIKIEINLNYFNTSSNKFIINILRELITINNNTKTINIDWYYEEDDVDMHQRGIELSSIIKHPFNIISIKE